MKEIWEDIYGYKNLYKINNKGEIYSYISKKIVKSSKKSNGYLFIHLYNKGTNKCKYIHRLVAEAFIPNPNNYLEVNHKDGNKLNNCVDNLEWCTKKQNMQHASKNNLIPKRYGADNIFSKKVIQLDLKYQPIKIWDSTGEILRELNIPKQNVSDNCNNKNYRTRNWIFMWFDDYIKISNMEQFALKRKKAFKHRIKRVLCIENNIIYENATQAQNITNANRTTIIKCCEGTRKTSGGLHWRYADE